MEAQQTQAIQQAQSQNVPGNTSGNVLPWGVPSSSTPNNSALPNPWGGAPAAASQPFGTYVIPDTH